MVATDPAPSTVNVTTSVAVPAQEEIVKRTTHRVNCHCGAVKFLMTLEEPFPAYKINRCSCTVCTKNGYELVYPLRQNVKFVSGMLRLFFGCCFEKLKLDTPPSLSLSLSLSLLKRGGIWFLQVQLKWSRRDVLMYPSKGDDGVASSLLPISLVPSIKKPAKDSHPSSPSYDS